MLYKSETLGSMRQLFQLGNVLRNSIVSLEQDRQRTSSLLLLGSYFLLLEIIFFCNTHWTECQKRARQLFIHK